MAFYGFCRDFIIGKDIPLGVNQEMVEKANAKVQQSIVFHIPAFANENLKMAYTVTYSLLGICCCKATDSESQCSASDRSTLLSAHRDQPMLADYSAVHRLLQH